VAAKAAPVSTSKRMRKMRRMRKIWRRKSSTDHARLQEMSTR
jgi:hypothetical protein